MKSCPAGRWHLRIWHLIYWLELAYDNSVPAFYLNKDGVNNSIGFACGSRQEINHLRLQSCAFSGKRTKRHSYSISTKLEVIAYAGNNSNEAAARKYRVYAKENPIMVQKEIGAQDCSASKRKEKTTGRRKKSLLQLSGGLRTRCSSGSTIWGSEVSAFPGGSHARTWGEIIWRELKSSNEINVPLVLRARKLKRRPNKIL